MQPSIDKTSEMDSMINLDLDSSNTESYQKCVKKKTNVPAKDSKGTKKRYPQRRILKKDVERNASKKQARVSKKVE